MDTVFRPVAFLVHRSITNQMAIDGKGHNLCHHLSQWLFYALQRVPDAKTDVLMPDVPQAAPLSNLRWPLWFRYAFAAAVTVAMLLVRMAIVVSFGERPLLILFIFPIILSAMAGGLGPGLVATFVAAVGADYYGILPLHHILLAEAYGRFQWGFLIANGVLVSILSEALHRSWRQVDANRRIHAVTLISIGDAVITTDTSGRISFLNPEAERLTGWAFDEAVGHPVPTVFKIINRKTGWPGEPYRFAHARWPRAADPGQRRADPVG